MNAENQNWEQLNEAKNRVIERLPGNNLIHEIHFVPINDKMLEIYVFYNRDEDVTNGATSGYTETIKKYFNEELDRVNKGPASMANIRFYFDSHENVVKNYQGSYFLRLR